MLGDEVRLAPRNPRERGGQLRAWPVAWPIVPQLETRAILSSPMRLNGWQRIFVVVAVLWSIPVIAFTVLDWPTEARLPRTEIFARLDPAVGARIIGYETTPGRAPEDPRRLVFFPDTGEFRPEKRVVRSANGTTYTFGRDATNAEVTAALMKDGAKAKGSEPLFVDVPMPVPINVAGHDLDVIPDESGADASVQPIAAAFGAALQDALLARRIRYAATAATVVIIPMAMLYVLGYSIAWIRRGFAAPTR
jgi:hypothetical protein